MRYTNISLRKAVAGLVTNKHKKTKIKRKNFVNNEKNLVKMIINNLFDIGDFVVSNTDKKSRKMIVVEIYVGATGLSYGVSYFDNKRTFWEYELEPFVEKIEKTKRGTFQPLTVKYLKSLEYDRYIKVLDANETKIIKEIVEMLAGAEEYEMAEVTKRYLDRVRDADNL